MENSSLSDGAQQADMVSNENADTKFGADQGETNMVKLVDGKLTAIGDTEDDIADDQLRNRYSDDDERAFNGDQNSGLTYENSEAGIRADDAQEGVDMAQVGDNPQAEAELTGNPDAGSDVDTGLPSEDDGSRVPTSSFVVRGDMVPPTPGTPGPVTPTPDPSQPIPPTPPSSPEPGPEIPDLPGTPKPETPEIQEPEQPGRSHEIGFRLSNRVYTSTVNTAVAGTQYEGMSAGPDEEGMSEKPDTGDSAHPYDVDAKDNADFQPGERPEEARETRDLPRELMDESSVQAQDMISDGDRSDEKSTEGLDRTYNDPQAARDMAS
ncbi:hypothetical protein GCM10027578_09750 [Spirosoma luteolum]